MPIISGTAVTSSLTSSGTVVVEYPEDIDMFGFSWNTTILDGWAFQGELSYRHNLPIQIDDVEVLFAGLSPLNADRKSVVSGKSVSVRVDLVGRRILKKKTIKI